MKRTFSLLVAGVLLAATVRSLDAADAKYAPPSGDGKHEVEVVLDDWTDVARDDRSVPVKIYMPKQTGEQKTAHAVIIFSHGLGGSRDGYEYVGRYWASHGFVSVHIQHIGSDDSVWKDARPLQRMAAMRRAANLKNSLERPKDVSFVIDELERRHGDNASPLHGRLDLKNLGMAGHSYGAYTTLAVGGQTFVPRIGKPQTFADERIKAMIPMSSPVPGREDTFDKAFGDIKIPALHMTGTLDTSPINDTTAEQRLVPFEHSKGPGDGGPATYLINFDGGDHAIFSGVRWRNAGEGDPAKDPTFHRLIRQTSLAFWQAYLNDDAAAKKWLDEGGMKELVGTNGEVKVKD